MCPLGLSQRGFRICCIFEPFMPVGPACCRSRAVLKFWGVPMRQCDTVSSIVVLGMPRMHTRRFDMPASACASGLLQAGAFRCFRAVLSGASGLLQAGASGRFRVLRGLLHAASRCFRIPLQGRFKAASRPLQLAASGLRHASMRRFQAASRSLQGRFKLLQLVLQA